MSEPLTPTDHRPPVLSYKGFRDLWTGQLVSQFGDILHFLVFLWWAGEVGGPVAVGTVMSCSVGAYLLLSLYAGTIADRFDRRRILLVSDLACTFITLAMVALAILEPKPPVWVLCLFAMALKSAFVFQRPARSAAIPRLVPPDRLLEANSLNMAAQTGMPLAGNALGAVVLGALFKLSASLAYVFSFSLNAVTFAISALFMARLPKIEPERDAPPKKAWLEAWEGIRFIFHHPVLRVAVLLFFGFELFVAPFMPAYVFAAQTTFRSGFTAFGFTFSGPALLSLLETGFFLGFVIGSLIVYRRPIKRVGAAFSTCISASALAIVPMGFVSSVPAFWLLNFACGLIMPFGVIPLETFMQAETPDAFRGRVSAATGTLAGSATPIGMASSGFLLAWFGLKGTFALIGLGLFAAALCGFLSPAFRRSRLSDTEARKEQAVGFDPNLPPVTVEKTA
jgi:DHA3 family macrolide efflux protein-like MFS transporter